MELFEDWPTETRLSAMDPNRDYDWVRGDDGTPWIVTYADSTRTKAIKVQTQSEFLKEQS